MNVHFAFHLVGFTMGLVAWVLIGVFAYRLYRKKVQKLKLWKVILVLYIGIFSFTLNWPMFDTMVKLPILPLGVWILYFILKKKEGRWEVYRSFAWLGFWANALFLAATLTAIPIQQIIYPVGKATTYISSANDASLIATHPSAKEQTINQKNLLKALPSMKQKTIDSDQWYEETYMGTESNRKNERFPYQLTATSPRWGSGLNPVIYIERDGKGLLVTTPEKQQYFRSDESFLGEGK